MQKLLTVFLISLAVTVYYVESGVLPVSSTQVAVVDASAESTTTTAIDTLGTSRVKRQGGCGCGCGCCCCRPKCCCCCRRCCTCCRTCCCTRCCTCCRPCCCGCGCGGGCGGCCGGCGCGCGCGCCGCGGGGRKRRSLQNLRIALANKIEGIAKIVAPATANGDEKKEVIN